MKTRISLRLCLYTELGPAGPRLRREWPLPVERFDFAFDAEGITDAEAARKRLQEYVDAAGPAKATKRRRKTNGA